MKHFILLLLIVCSFSCTQEKPKKPTKKPTQKISKSKVLKKNSDNNKTKVLANKNLYWSALQKELNLEKGKFKKLQKRMAEVEKAKKEITKGDKEALKAWRKNKDKETRKVIGPDLLKKKKEFDKNYKPKK